MANPPIVLEPEYFHAGDIWFKQKIVVGSETTIIFLCNSYINRMFYGKELFKINSIGQFFNMNGTLIGALRIVDFKIDTWEFETIPVTILDHENEGERTFKFTATNSDIYEIEREVIKWMVKEKIIDLFKDIVVLNIFAEKIS